MTIQSICDSITKLINAARTPLNTIPAAILVCSAINRPGLSPMLIASNIIRRQSEAGAPFGAAADGSANIAEAMERIRVEEMVKALKMDAKVQVAKGLPLSKPIRDMELFPPMLPQMIKIGEETGNIEDMMDKVADYYEMEVEAATDALTAAMEPMVIVLMAVVVGGIVIAIYSPMLGMYDAIDNY